MISLPVTTRQLTTEAPSQWTIGSITVSHGLQKRCHAPDRGAVLLIRSSHAVTLHHATLQQILRPPLDLIYLPAGAYGFHTSPFHGWQLSLDLEDLTFLAAELSDHRLSPARFRRRLETVRTVQARNCPQRDLCEALLPLLQLTATPSFRQHQHFDLVGLHQTIQRLIVLLICADLIEGALQPALAERGSKTLIFDELLVWIQANLHRSIQLKDLVEQSGYSQRSLRNFFQERFGCGPIHWIRTSRLQAARERLLNPEPEDTVSSIAMAYGYGHLSQFSRDFQNTYQVRPSELLREGHRGQLAP